MTEVKVKRARKSRKAAMMGTFNFKLIDMTAYFDEVIKQEGGTPNASAFGGSAHTYFANDANGVCTIVEQPITQFVDPAGKIIPAWGPARQDQRNAGYHEPVKEGTFGIDPDGSWAIWTKDLGYVQQPGAKPVAVFGPDGICTVEGFTPGGRYYLVGADADHPSTPPAVADSTPQINELLTAAINYSKAVVPK